MDAFLEMYSTDLVKDPETVVGAILPCLKAKEIVRQFTSMVRRLSFHNSVIISFLKSTWKQLYCGFAFN